MDIKKEKIWVNWKKEEKDGRFTKIPYQPNGKKASSTDSKTWSTFDEVTKAIPNFSGIGVVFEPSTGVIGIDFDNCVDHEFFGLAKTYCEYSPSKKGMHLLFIADGPIELERNKENFGDYSVEIYTKGRYFTYTGDEHPISTEIRTINQADFHKLIKTLGYPWKKEKKESSNTQSPKKITTLGDEEVKEKMFGAKNGGKIKKLWDGEIGDYNNDTSSADFALCAALSFWTGRDKEQMRRLWLESPLGGRAKTQERVDYQERTLDNAIAGTTEVYTQRSSQPINDSEEGYLMTGGKNPKVVLNLENICRVLKRDSRFNDKFRLNDFSHMVETTWDQPEGKWINLFDNSISEVQRIIQTNYPEFLNVSRAMTQDAVLSLAYHNKVNPPRDFFSSLVWDKVPRLDSWLHVVYGVDDNELYQKIGSNWIKGLVKRVMIPGCIFDEVLALESPQGWRKSTSIRELGSPWHVETTHSVDDKDFFMQLAQNIIVEFAEGDIFDKASIKKLKAEVTKTADQFRPPYERGMMTFKRGCVFAVTTNKLELKDETGNRRWLPVELKKVADIDWIRENREQLFAEAYYRVMVLKETTHEYPQESLEELQESRMEWTDGDETVVNWYVSQSEEAREEGFTLKDFYEEVYPGQPSGDKRKEWELSTILKRALHLSNKNTRINGNVCRRWRPTERTYKIIKNIKPLENNIENF